MLNLILQPILGILSIIIKIIVWPINQVIINTMPDISQKLSDLGTNISTLFSSVNWALGVVPSPLIITLLFILSVEVARHTIFVSTHIVGKIFELIRKLKFW